MEHRGEDCARFSPGLDLLPGGFGPQPHPADQPRVWGTVRSFGVRLPRCSARSFHKKGARPELPSKLVEGLEPIALETIAPRSPTELKTTTGARRATGHRRTVSEDRAIATGAGGRAAQGGPVLLRADPGGPAAVQQESNGGGLFSRPRVPGTDHSGEQEDPQKSGSPGRAMRDAKDPVLVGSANYIPWARSPKKTRISD